jgi:hypothetical protein
MFPENFQVLKIPARSQLLSAKSWVSVMGATSATLAARGGSEGDFGGFASCLRQAVLLSGVEILFRPVNEQKITTTLWERACSRRLFHSRHRC